jgi:hypothetical protein
MSEIKIVAAIMGDERTAYRFGEPLLDKPESVVDRILLVGNNVEVFARSTTDQTLGFHESLLPPSVATLIALVSKGAGGEFLAQVLSAMDSGEKVNAVYATDGKVWKLNGPVPNDDKSRIVKIAQSEDMVEIVAIPGTGSELDVAGYFLHFTLMPLSFLRVSAEAPLDEWMGMQQVMIAGEEEDDDDDDDDDDGDEEPVEGEQVTAAPVSLIPRVPPPPPPPPQPNGAAQPTQTQTQTPTE